MAPPAKLRDVDGSTSSLSSYATERSISASPCIPTHAGSTSRLPYWGLSSPEHPHLREHRPAGGSRGPGPDHPRLRGEPDRVSRPPTKAEGSLWKGMALHPGEPLTLDASFWSTTPDKSIAEVRYRLEHLAVPRPAGDDRGRRRRAHRTPRARGLPCRVADHRQLEKISDVVDSDGARQVKFRWLPVKSR